MLAEMGKIRLKLFFVGVCVFVFHAKLKLKNAIDCSSEDNYQEDPLLSGARVGRFDTVVVIIGTGVIICPPGDCGRERGWTRSQFQSGKALASFGWEFLSLRSRVVTRDWAGATADFLGS